MSTYFADENTKQIAVRKVFGADVNSETWRNVRSYMILTGIACLIGIPLADAKPFFESAKSQADT
ncbi:MAG: hypothetical protein J6W82_02990 [Bacteroidales bacterium]|nr:hypothetical protein [Bacteroidales bacterium]